MTDSTIGVAEPGSPTKLLQSYQNTVSSQTVQAEGVVQVDLNGVPVPRGTKADPVVIGFLYSDGTSVIVPQVTNGTPASNAQGLVVRSVGSQVVTGTVTANQGTANAAQQWPILAYVDSFATPGTNKKLVVDDSSFPGVTPLQVAPIGQGPGGVSSSYLQFDANANLKTAQQGTVTVTQNLLGSNDKPDITANQSGILQTNNDNDRRIQERLLMLAELGTINSLIAADNGPGASNYQELR